MKNDKDVALVGSSIKKLTIRLLNSPLSGCEFELSEQTTLFIVAPAKTLEQSTFIQTNAFIIPMEEGGLNFEVILGDNIFNEVRVREQHTLGQKTKKIRLNSIINIGSLQVAIKSASEAWSIDFTQLATATEVKSSNKSRKKIMTVFSLFFLVLTFAVWLQGGTAAALKPEAQLTAAVVSQPIKLAVPASPPMKIKALSADDAEFALREMSLPYVRANNSNNVSFTVSGLINDESLQQLKLLIVRYKGQPVNFNINLQDDYTANKSFKYGSEGYIKISPEHWLVNNI